MIEFQPVAFPGSGSGALQAGSGGHVTSGDPPAPPPPLLLPLPPLPPEAPAPVVVTVLDVPDPQAETANNITSEPKKEVVRCNMLT
jgi:hypothetical protein